MLRKLNRLIEECLRQTFEGNRQARAATVITLVQCRYH